MGSQSFFNQKDGILATLKEISRCDGCNTQQISVVAELNVGNPKVLYLHGIDFCGYAQAQAYGDRIREEDKGRGAHACFRSGLTVQGIGQAKIRHLTNITGK